MIKKWDIAPAPSDKNPGRHKLLINGEMKDIFLIVKKLGGLCSRPEKHSGEYNFLIYLSQLEMDTVTKIKVLAAELSKPSEQTPPRAAMPFAEPQPFELPKPKLKISPEPRAPAPAPAPQPRPQAPAPVSQPQAPVPAPAPKIQPQPSPAPAPAPAPQTFTPHVPPSPMPVPAPQPQFQAQAPVPAPAPRIQPQPASSPIPAPQPPQEEKPADTGRSMPFGPPSASARIKQEALAFAKEYFLQKSEPEEKPAEAPKPAQAPKPGAGTRIGKTRWSVELPLVPTYSFQTLVSGSHNRFAHAAAMAVVENPGMIYNPLLIFGVPGTGKTHFIHSISYGLSSSIGQSNIFVTDGIKLSKGVDLAVREGSIKKLADTISRVKALIIDDIHLLMLTEANKPYISRWLNEFMTANKQIVVTSVFPPKLLGGLEESVGFQFTQGWMVDLKAPAAASYKVILNQLLQGMDVKLADDEMNNIFTARAMSFGEAVKTLESMKKLEKFMVNAASPLSHAQLLDMLLGLSETAVGMALSGGESDAAQSWNPSAKDSWFKWGLFYPRGMQTEARFVLVKLHEKILELGLRIEWQQVFLEEYDPDELYGINFKIGNFSSEKNANGVIILGPQPTSALGTQEAEFRHITMKILDSFLVKGAWLPSGNIKSAAAYVKTLMNLI
ncbi:MAG: ATP-binding protein [Elusimicrobia bacterium]|nr:ATP-binding protein [Elusimicrobiota bacterium]